MLWLSRYVLGITRRSAPELAYTTAIHGNSTDPSRKAMDHQLCTRIARKKHTIRTAMVHR